ncbi:hypothetical protein GGR52DRAFT_65945 [Hypoxylon sp. FL1284]|nr:hypothetical protein GGR52DRAFT_65945 [Hypoxylon sp. FL1284]
MSSPAVVRDRRFGRTLLVQGWLHFYCGAWCYAVPVLCRAMLVWHIPASALWPCYFCICYIYYVHDGRDEKKTMCCRMHNIQYPSSGRRIFLCNLASHSGIHSFQK